MKSVDPRNQRLQGESEKMLGASRRPVTLMTIGLTGAALITSVVFHFHSTPSANTSSQNTGESGGESETYQATQLQIQEQRAPRTLLSGREAERVELAAKPEGAVDARSSVGAEEAMARLSQLDATKALTPEQGLAIKRDLQQLLDEGPDALRTIHQFLKQGQDLRFNEANSKLIGAPTLRTALIETLRQVGTPEAVDLSREIMNGTVDPLEVAQLARNLEEKASGQYRQEELQAAHTSLELAASGQLKGRDISPLFEMFHAFGDETAVAQMKQIAATGKWLNYLPYVMAEVPDEAGVSALTELLNEPGVMAMDQQNAILRSVAVAAINHPEAATKLTDRARQNQIPDAAWSRVAAVLGGDTYRPYQGTVFSDTAQQSALSAEQVMQRLSLIDQLAAASASQVARDALNQARARLAAISPGK